MTRDYVQPSNIPDSIFTIFIFGLCLLFPGALMELAAPKSDNLTTQTEGVVSRVERDKKHYITYVRYEDHDHCEHEAKSLVNDQSKRHDEGDVVTIKYDKYNPDDRCLIQGDEDDEALFTIIGRVFLFGGGAASLVSGSILLWRRLKRRQLTLGQHESGKGGHITREEFNLQRLKDDAATNRRTFPILLGCVILFVAFSIYALITGKAPAGIGSILIMVSIALLLPLMKRKIGTHDKAIREYESHMADPSTPLSESTKDAIAVSAYPPSELLKGWVALFGLGALLIAMGVLLLLVSEGSEALLLVLGAGFAIGGVVVCFPAARLHRSWKVAKALDEAGQ